MRKEERSIISIGTSVCSGAFVCKSVKSVYVDVTGVCLQREE